MRDFTDKALQRRETRRKTQLDFEIAANEEKLKQARLIQSDDKQEEEAILEAEFMPMPGTIKYKDSWISKGTTFFIKNESGVIPPWGGRFKLSQSAENTKVIIFKSR